ncbi:amino acid ABC transporter substrate-binding protein [Azospirillum sp. SYSU D00513]|uniref:amino acid ABC transporter substrate-binding protein n=1 Tax=Azospirillum sp. SYSU D00513 TaxID=2812561 RepID=UPI001A959834|nr:amino acid ABC transporter substrate-binding protein [Azospirillum sp. SYSU D00513]
MKSGLLAAAAAAMVIGAVSGAQAGATLDAVKAKGFVQCGVNTGLAGFSNPDSSGNWSGLDADYCRAVAVALFNDPTKVKFTPLSAQQRFPAIQSGEVDMLSRNTTATLTRDTSVGLNFAPVTFYDGQGFMVSNKLGVKSAKELNGATVCVQSGTTTELNLADYFRANNMSYNPVVIESQDEVNAAFFAGRCDVLTTDASGLAGVRASVAPNPADYTILPEIISKEPLAPAVRHGDEQWYDIVKWVVYATIDAEEKGITSKNLDQFLNSQNPDVQRLLGTSAGMGKALGLDEKWAYNVIKTMGNYGEIFERNVGANTPLKLARGVNALWTNGGLQYAQPLR